MGARESALQVLIACRREEGWSNARLKSQLSHDRLDRREAALASRLCYGVVQNRLKLDFYLRQLLTGKLSALHPVVRDVLHMGLYQLLETDRIPDAAAVNESVRLVKKYCPRVSVAPGLVNAVLRKAAVQKDQLLQPRSYVDKYSHPQALVDLLKANVGSKALEGMLIANNTPPQTVVQVNTLRTDVPALTQQLQQQGLGVQPHGWMDHCLCLSATGSLETLQAFRDGLFYVQDPASRLAVKCAGLAPHMQVLDCCAAPGGKSFAAAIAMKGQGRITSCDIHPHKLSLIESGASRLGLDSISVQLQDASQLQQQWVERFDAVLADVPCSGYGIIRKKPDIRYKDPAAMEQLPQLQLQILRTQARYVKPGGVLLYSTCTVLHRENRQVVEAFLEENRDFTLEALPLEPPICQDQTGMLTLIPGQFDTDGFFICKLRKR